MMSIDRFFKRWCSGFIASLAIVSTGWGDVSPILPQVANSPPMIAIVDSGPGRVHNESGPAVQYCSRPRSSRRSQRIVRRSRTGGWSLPGLDQNQAVAPVVDNSHVVDPRFALPPPDPNAVAPVSEQPPVSLEVQAIAKSSNQFAFDLYQKLRSKDGNLCFSPASISTGTAMTFAGAAHSTKQQISDVLHLNLPDPQVHAGFRQLNSILNTKSVNHQLRTANRLWVQSGFAFQQPFLDTIRENYGSSLGEVDFQQPETTNTTINHWVEEQTDGHIRELISAGMLQETTRFVLTNAIYFKGTWKFRFPESATADAPFLVTEQQQISVPTMKLIGALRYSATPDVQLLELPYVGGQLSMLVVLPKKKDGLAELEQKLTFEEMQKWIAALQEEEEVDVHLPKFKFDSKTELPEVLSSLGMRQAFSNEADFSGITTEKAQKLSDAVHQAYIDVNEAGTEAAAATGFIGGDAPGPVPQTVYFHADHPFLFLIQDIRTGAILFQGRVVNPSAS